MVSQSLLDPITTPIWTELNRALPKVEFYFFH
jgi:hypothetical protein